MTGPSRVIPLVCLCCAAVAQTRPAPSFDVASVKLSGMKAGSWCRFLPGGRLEAVSWISQLLQIAYGVEDYQVVGGPGWFTSDRYDIQAKAENPDAGKSEMLLMLQSLLADRFKLKLHTETRDFPGFNLVLDKGGPKLRPLKEGEASQCGPGNSYVCGITTVADLANSLHHILRQPVFDKTDVEGRFDILLDFDTFTASGRTPPPDYDKPSLSQALRDQLGLRLEAQKAALPVLVIDSVERPAAN